MKLSRINKITDYRIFSGFVWPTALLPFAQFNVIYGWNGAGKTTLAALLKSLQRREQPARGAVEFEFDGRVKLGGTDLPTALSIPQVRVFDRDFINDTILAVGEKVAPIYFVGPDSVQQSKEADRLGRELARTEQALEQARDRKTAADSALDRFCIEKAKLVKEALTGSRSTSYNNYDKRRMKSAFQALTTESCQHALLTEEEKERHKQQKNAQPR